MSGFSSLLCSKTWQFPYKAVCDLSNLSLMCVQTKIRGTPYPLSGRDIKNFLISSTDLESVSKFKLG